MDKLNEKTTVHHKPPSSRNIEIYERDRAGEYQADLAREYGISRQRINAIVESVKQWIAEKGAL